VRVLIVGAGAVGLVYGAHLAEGGAEVSVYVRPSRKDEASAGYTLTRVGVLGGRTSRRFVPKSVVTSAAEVAAGEFEHVWVATATNALDEPWLAEVLAGCPRALVIFLQPGGDALARMEALVPEAERRVRGAISMASWHAPLEGSRDVRETSTPAGWAYVLPPGGPSGFEGPRAPEVVRALRAGQCPAAIAHVTASLATGSAVLLPHIATLETAGWSVQRMGTGEVAALAARSSREALAIACARVAIAVPLALRLFVRPFTTRLVALLARTLAPFDVETYLRVHFTKVHAQTMMLLAEYVRDAEARGLPHDALRTLRAKLG
jgi:2-dehydropantoate 2-reductase